MGAGGRPGRSRQAGTWRLLFSCRRLDMFYSVIPRRHRWTGASSRKGRAMSETPKHSVSVAGIVIDSAERVLVIRRRDNGHWEMPGGVLELSEQFEDGVRREVAEETGMVVHVDQLTGVYKNMSRGIV